MWVNGEFDPWRALSVDAQSPSSLGKGQKSFVYKNATHCNDLWGPVNQTEHMYPLGKCCFFGALPVFSFSLLF
jgi:hypothetical protein